MDIWKFINYFVCLIVFLLFKRVELLQQCQSEDVTDNQREVYVFEHNCIVLRCSIPNVNESVAISKAGDIFVRDLRKQTTDPRFHYTYSNNNPAEETLHELKISNISTYDDGTWSFIYNMWHSISIKIHVLTRPSYEEPTCVTRNKFPVYIINDLLELNCSLQESYPLITFNVDGPCDTQNSSFEVTTQSSQADRNLGCKSVLTEVDEGRQINCSFYQTYPPKSGLPPYHNFCQWGPINIVGELNVSITLRSPSIIKGTSITFECVCNVPDAIITCESSAGSVNQQSSEPGRSTVIVRLPVKFAHNTLDLSCRATYRGREASENFEGAVSTKENSNSNAPQRLIPCVYLLIALPLLVPSF